jgi:hypothetical protein
VYSTLDLPFAVLEAYREEQAAESVPSLLSDTYKVTSIIDGVVIDSPFMRWC